MTNIQNTFIGILRAYIQNETYNIPPDTDFNALFELSKIHNVTGIVAAVLKTQEIELPGDISQKFDSHLMATVTQSIKWDIIYKEVSEALASNHIKNIAVKGPIMKKYYPDPDLRTMGDIDLVIHKDSMQKAHKVMEQIGFSICESSIDEYKFHKNNMYVELHEDLTSTDFGTGVDYKSEMQFIFNSVKNPDAYIQELKDDCHLIYLVLHIANHLFSSGCGVRQILDIALALKHFDLNLNYVLQRFNKLKLTNLSNSIFYLCYNWFDVKSVDCDIDLELYEFLTQHILTGGVFGFDAHREDNIKIRDSITENNKLKFLIKCAFPDIKQMRSNVLWFRTKPAVLLPIAWVYRWIKSYNDHPDRINTYLKKSIISSDKNIEYEYQMLKKLGFYQNQK